VASNGVLNLNGSVALYGALTNAGTVNWQAGEMDVYNHPSFGETAEIWNEAGALWDIQCDQALVTQYNLVHFHNAGVLRKSAGTGTNTSYIYLNNTGTVHAESGVVQFTGGSDLGGSFQADTGATIYFAGGSYTLSSTPTNFLGPGAVQITGGFVTLNAFVGALDIYSAVVSGTLSGTLNMLNGGGINSPLTVLNNGVLNINGSLLIYGGVLMNEGTVNWNGGTVQTWGAQGGEIWNGVSGLWNIRCDQEMDDATSGYGRLPFNNFGTMRKSAGTGICTISLDFDNSGILDVESGTISFTGAYSNSPSASLAISLGGAAPGSGYSTISFFNPLSFDGTFSLSTRNGYLPNPGDAFRVLSYPSATSSFTCLGGLDLGGGILLQPQFGVTGLTLLATAYTTNASQPQLFITHTLGGAAITWPDGFPGWTLQSSTNLSSSAWTTVSNACGNQATVPISAPQQFLRLSH